MKSDLVVGGLLVTAWTLSSFGTAQQNWPLVGAAIPSMTLALIVQVAAMARRNRQGRRAIEEIRARHATDPSAVQRIEKHLRTEPTR